MKKTTRKSLENKLNSYITDDLLNYDLCFMPKDSKKMFEKIFLG